MFDLCVSQMLTISIADRSILLSTSAPFESSDAEDKNIVGVGEILTRIMTDLEQYNKEHPEAPVRAVSRSCIGASYMN